MVTVEPRDLISLSLVTLPVSAFIVSAFRNGTEIRFFRSSRSWA